MKNTFLKIAALAASLLGASVASAQSAEAAFFNSTASLGGTTVTDTWTGLTAANHPGYPSFPGTGAWPAPISPNVDADSGSDAWFNKIGGGGYPASGSIYPFSEGVFSVGATDALDGLQTVVFQINYQDPGSDVSGLTLSFNGGSQALVADVTFDLVQGASQASLYQWDLSGYGTVTDFTITWTQPAHGAIQGLQLTQGTVHSAVSAVPEPSSFAALAGLGALGLVASRRRRGLA